MWWWRITNVATTTVNQPQCWAHAIAMHLWHDNNQPTSTSNIQQCLHWWLPTSQCKCVTTSCLYTYFALLYVLTGLLHIHPAPMAIHRNHLHILAQCDCLPICMVSLIFFAICLRSIPHACTLTITGALMMADNTFRHHLCSQQDNGADNNDNWHCIPCHFHHHNDMTTFIGHPVSPPFSPPPLSPLMTVTTTTRHHHHHPWRWWWPPIPQAHNNVHDKFFPITATITTDGPPHRPLPLLMIASPVCHVPSLLMMAFVVVAVVHHNALFAMHHHHVHYKDDVHYHQVDWQWQMDWIDSS